MALHVTVTTTFHGDAAAIPTRPFVWAAAGRTVDLVRHVVTLRITIAVSPLRDTAPVPTSPFIAPAQDRTVGFVGFVVTLLKTIAAPCLCDTAPVLTAPLAGLATRDWSGGSGGSGVTSQLIRLVGTVYGSVTAVVQRNATRVVALKLLFLAAQSTVIFIIFVRTLHHTVTLAGKGDVVFA